MQQEPNPPIEPIEPDEPDAGEGEGRSPGRGKDRPVDPDTGRREHPEHPHGGPPGHAGRPPKPPKPRSDDQGGEDEGDTGGV